VVAIKLPIRKAIFFLNIFQTDVIDNEEVDEGRAEMTENEPLSDDDHQDIQEVDPDAPFTFGQGTTMHSLLLSYS
jgi:hypothetical protein